MFDISQNEDHGEEEPSWEDFFATWVDYLSKCANYYGLYIVQNKLILPEGQNKAMFAMAMFNILETKSELHRLYPDHERIISRLPY